MTLFRSWASETKSSLEVQDSNERSDRKSIRSIKGRIFFTCWLLFSVHFATNVVREHYPAFSIAEHGTFRVDEYLGFHPDIFLHSNGHAVIGNNVAGSLVAAIPLFLFDPLLDYLESLGKAQVAHGGNNLYTTYKTDKPNRRKFFKLVKEQGLHLRFGGATFVTSVFLMAPLSAFFVGFIFSVLIHRGVQLKRAIWLALLFAFATPVFFRTAHLNHNMFMMMVVFWSFYLIWSSLDTEKPDSTKTYIGAGFLAGSSFALDYAGVIPLAALSGYVFFASKRKVYAKAALRNLFIFVLGALPAVLFLWYSQWSMYGHPFYPGQYWMPEVNYTDRGWRGMSWPSLDLYFLNLFSLDYGMFTFAPLLIIGFIPTFFYGSKNRILPRRERRFIALFVLMFLTFCAANQYSRMQFNTGFRYLLPIVPFVFLIACEHLTRLSSRWLAIISLPLIFHSWVLCMFRESVPVSWGMFFSEGVELPWLSVLKATSKNLPALVSNSLLPPLILAICGIFVFMIWKWHPISRDESVIS